MNENTETVKFKKLTKSERLEVYKIAKEKLLSSTYNNGLCNALDRALYNIQYYDYNNFFFKNLLEILPEFKAIMPKNAVSNEYWWPKENRTIRLEALDKMIELASNSIY